MIDTNLLIPQVNRALLIGPLVEAGLGRLAFGAGALLPLHVHDTFSPWGSLSRPEWSVWQGGEPEGWRGSWGLNRDGLSLDFAGDISHDARGIGGMGGGGGAAGGSLGFSSSTLSQAEPADVIRGSRKGACRRHILRQAQQRGEGQGREAKRPPSSSPNCASTSPIPPSGCPRSHSTLMAELRAKSTFRNRSPPGVCTAMRSPNPPRSAMRPTKSPPPRTFSFSLEAPRFFVERDEVVLSANVHNYLTKSKTVRAELNLPANLRNPSLPSPIPWERGWG